MKKAPPQCPPQKLSCELELVGAEGTMRQRKSPETDVSEDFLFCKVFADS